MIKIETLICGPIENNVYIVFDDESHEAVVIDPSFEPEGVGKFIQTNHLVLSHLLVTHAHFDHYYGVPYLLKMFPEIDSVFLHENDFSLWQSGGEGRAYLGTVLDHIKAPLCFVTDREELAFSKVSFQVRLVPGHSSGSVIYYCSAQKCAFVGDTIFLHGIGRTDLPGGDQDQLLAGVRTKILTLPGETILLPGHGRATTVAEELRNNPFL